MPTPRFLPHPRRALIAGLAAGALLTTGASAIAAPAPSPSGPTSHTAAISQVTAQAPIAKIMCDNPNVNVFGIVNTTFYRAPGKNRAAGAYIRISGLSVAKPDGAGPGAKFEKGNYTIGVRGQVLMQGKAGAKPIASKARAKNYRVRARGNGEVLWKLGRTVMNPAVPRMRDAFAQEMIAGAASVSITIKGPKGMRANCSATQAVGAATTWA